ncbi:type IV pilus modification PilV family protein [Candidatus Clostridium helianthi]|jgi:prepilin-type N-terminal cleavage/methylation domain|uniref:Prepilin-type N-terminal cleavage/methylation domain-containing protein n=1 Tax=Candidatus Clostridium helianthi TaxID=3381660 RepID=A0ABW8S0R7_9CLOT
MREKSKKHGGFTLVEMIISFALLAILMTPIYSMIISTMNHNKSGEIKQTASLKGQELFEEIKNEDIYPVIDGGNITGIKIGDTVSPTSINPESGKREVTKDIGNGYEAKVSITKNNSINLDKTVTSIATSDFSVNLSGPTTLGTLTVGLNSEKEGILHYTDSEDVLNLVVNTKTEGNKKLIVIKDRDNNVIKDKDGNELSGELEVSDEEKDNQIKLTLNFDDYKVSRETDPTKLRSFKVSVYNQDDVPLNICLQKSMDLDVSVDTKMGNVRTFDNRTSSSNRLGELYDIDVVITQTTNGETKVIFTGKTSQNININ